MLLSPYKIHRSRTSARGSSTCYILARMRNLSELRYSYLKNGSRWFQLIYCCWCSRARGRGCPIDRLGLSYLSMTMWT